MTGHCAGAKKIVRLHRFFLHQISLESKLNGRQKVKGGNGSISASISTSLIASVIASLITLNLGVGCAPSCCLAVRWGRRDCSAKSSPSRHLAGQEPQASVEERAGRDCPGRTSLACSERPTNPRESCSLRCRCFSRTAASPELIGIVRSEELAHGWLVEEFGF